MPDAKENKKSGDNTVKKTPKSSTFNNSCPSDKNNKGKDMPAFPIEGNISQSNDTKQIRKRRRGRGGGKSSVVKNATTSSNTAGSNLKDKPPSQDCNRILSGWSAEKNNKDKGLPAFPIEGNISQCNDTKQIRKRRRGRGGGGGKSSVVKNATTSSNTAGSNLKDKPPSQDCNINLSGCPSEKNNKGKDLPVLSMVGNIAQDSGTKKNKKRRRGGGKSSVAKNPASSSNTAGSNLKDKPPSQDSNRILSGWSPEKNNKGKDLPVLSIVENFAQDSGSNLKDKPPSQDCNRNLSVCLSEKNNKVKDLPALPIAGNITQDSGTKNIIKRRGRRGGKSYFMKNAATLSNTADKPPSQDCNRNLSGCPSKMNNKGKDLPILPVVGNIAQNSGTKKNKKIKRGGGKSSVAKNPATSSNTAGRNLKDKPTSQECSRNLSVCPSKMNIKGKDPPALVKNVALSSNTAASNLKDKPPSQESNRKLRACPSEKRNKAKDLPSLPKEGNISQVSGTKKNTKTKRGKSSLVKNTASSSNKAGSKLKDAQQIQQMLKTQIKVLPEQQTSGRKDTDFEQNQKWRHLKNLYLDFIYQEAPLRKFEYVAIDCEMVMVKSRRMALARVSIVDQKGKVLLDKYVKPDSVVIDFKTHISGIRPIDVANGEDFTRVRTEVLELVKDKIIVGHSLKNDFQALKIGHPLCHVRDTANYQPLRRYATKGRTPGLKGLCKAILGRNIQSGEHCSVEDARAVMDIYNTISKQWEESLTHSRTVQNRMYQSWVTCDIFGTTQDI